MIFKTFKTEEKSYINIIGENVNIYLNNELDHATCNIAFYAVNGNPALLENETMITFETLAVKLAGEMESLKNVEFAAYRMQQLTMIINTIKNI